MITEPVRTYLIYFLIFLIYLVILLFFMNNAALKDIFVVSVFFTLLTIIFNLYSKAEGWQPDPVSPGAVVYDPNEIENKGGITAETTDITGKKIMPQNPNDIMIKSEFSPTIKQIQEEAIKDTDLLEKTEYENSVNTEENPAYQSGDIILTNENKYDMYGKTFIDANTIYVPPDYEFTKDDYGWSYLPAKLWVGINNWPIRPPIAYPATKRCLVKANLAPGYPVDLKEWHRSRRVMGPDSIHTRYIEEKLNSGY